MFIGTCSMRMFTFTGSGVELSGSAEWDRHVATRCAMRGILIEKGYSQEAKKKVPLKEIKPFKPLGHHFIKQPEKAVAQSDALNRYRCSNLKCGASERPDR